jgi:hypothetical protein
MHNFVTFIVETVVTRVINEVCNFDRVTVNLQEVALHKEDKINCKKNCKGNVSHHAERRTVKQRIIQVRSYDVRNLAF